MSKYLKTCSAIMVLLSSILLSSMSYAITVSVHSPSNEVYALGFQLNGKDYGGAGTSYSRSNLPAGMYIFGIRVGGLLIGAKDVGCPYKGKKAVMLSKDTRAVLNYNGRTCSTSIR